MGERLFYTQEVIGSIPISPTRLCREDWYLDGAHNPVLVGSTPTPATKKNIEKNLTLLFSFDIIVSER